MQKNITTKNMENKNLTAVDWYFDKIKSHFEHDGDLYEVACMTYQLAKEMEKQHIVDAFVECWKENMPEGYECKQSAEEYYNETFKTN
jgi:hypothetical protein